MRIFLILIVHVYFSAILQAQCIYQGNKYNVGTIITINGAKQKCSCIIETKKPFEECSAQWVIIQESVKPSTNPPIDQPVSKNAADMPNYNSWAHHPLQIQGFWKKQDSGYYLVMNFSGHINLNFTQSGKVFSYDDLSDLNISAEYESECKAVEKMDKRGFGGTLMEATDVAFTPSEIKQKNEWIGKKLILNSVTENLSPENFPLTL